MCVNDLESRDRALLFSLSLSSPKGVMTVLMMLLFTAKLLRCSSGLKLPL